MDSIAWFSPAQIVGYAALVLGVSAFLQKSDKRLKVLISCESLFTWPTSRCCPIFPRREVLWFRALAR
jgi:hypothetical protein